MRTNPADCKESYPPPIFVIFLVGLVWLRGANEAREEGSGRSVTEAQSYFDGTGEVQLSFAVPCSPGLRSPRRLGLPRTRAPF